MPQEDKNIEEPKEKEKISRRKFFLWVGWGGLITSLVGSFLGTARFLFPKVLLEPPSSFKLGKPEDYGEGSITFSEEHNIFILHEKAGFKALSAVCTHVGCIVYWNQDQNKFICPCHGSIFSRNGKVLRGAAIGPLKSFSIKLAKDRRLLVDTRKTVKKEDYFRV
ncbi:MAG: Rieske 2Fe-2S domain-containing protein [Candidatus Zixiibacteriota bacterium]